MLPERTSEPITQNDVLVWFGLSGREGLFPCPPDITLPSNPIPRAATSEALQHLANGERVLLLHGAGGCGKTTLTDQIGRGLPAGSVAIVFDCFGGGRYIYAD